MLVGLHMIVECIVNLVRQRLHAWNKRVESSKRVLRGLDVIVYIVLLLFCFGAAHMQVQAGLLTRTLEFFSEGLELGEFLTVSPELTLQQLECFPSLAKNAIAERFMERESLPVCRGQRLTNSFA